MTFNFLTAVRNFILASSFSRRTVFATKYFILFASVADYRKGSAFDDRNPIS